jgi:hypothetical protein
MRLPSVAQPYPDQQEQPARWPRLHRPPQRQQDTPPDSALARLGLTRHHFIMAALCALGIMAWRAAQNYSTGVFDIYPLYYGAKAWLLTGNAYDFSLVAPVSDHPLKLYQIGNGYPLLAVLIVLPLALLPPKVASILWLGGVTAALFLSLRLIGAPLWAMLYYPLIEGLLIEQYTVFVLVVQILGVWAYRTRRPWVLAFACALSLSKPQQAIGFVLLMLFLTRDWRRHCLALAATWGVVFLLDPNWIVEWWGGVQRHLDTDPNPYLWQLGLFILPLLLLRNPLGAATLVPTVLTKFQIPSTYMAAPFLLSVLEDRRVGWLVLASYFYIPLTAEHGPLSATGLSPDQQAGVGIALTLVLPMALLSYWRWRTQPPPAAEVSA